MSNIHFQRKIVSDELRDTLFFATGNRAEKIRSPEYVILRVPEFEVKIVSFKNISVNSKKCRSSFEAKSTICRSIIL